MGGRTHLIEDHLLAHIVHFLSMKSSQCHRYQGCEQTHQQGAKLDNIRVLQLRSRVNNAARDEFSVRGEDAPSRRIRWTCHRREGRAYAVVRPWKELRNVHLAEWSCFEGLARELEVVCVQVGNRRW